EANRGYGVITLGRNSLHRPNPSPSLAQDRPIEPSKPSQCFQVVPLFAKPGKLIAEGARADAQAFRSVLFAAAFTPQGFRDNFELALPQVAAQQVRLCPFAWISG